jgi:hypothetical protein
MYIAKLFNLLRESVLVAYSTNIITLDRVNGQSILVKDLKILGLGFSSNRLKIKILPNLISLLIKTLIALISFSFN